MNTMKLGRYIHHSGRVYIVIANALSVPKNKNIVVYQPLYDVPVFDAGMTFTRKVEEFKLNFKYDPPEYDFLTDQ